MKTPESVIYNKPTEIEKFDKIKFINSITQFGDYDPELLDKGLDELSQYHAVHVSRLVELGTQCILNEQAAKQYYDNYYNNDSNFERLRRITGYLVGTLDRWNDGKKAEEKERVKHTITEKQQKEQMKFTQEKALGKI